MSNYSYKENELIFFGNETIFDEKIEKVIEFEKCIVVLTEITNSETYNNMFILDNKGNILWRIEDIINNCGKQAVVEMWKSGSECVEVQTFNGLRVLINVNSGSIVEKTITK